MTFPTVVGQTTFSNNASPTLPSFSVGDLLLVNTISLTSPSGASSASGGTWTLIGSSNIGTTTFQRTWAKVAQTGDSFTLSGGFSYGGFATSLSGWSGNLADIGYAAVTGSLNPPSLNMGTSLDYEWFAGAANYQNAISAAPTSYTNLATATADASDHKIAFARRARTVSSEDPAAFSGTANFAGAWTIGIKPLTSQTFTQNCAGSSTPAGAPTGGKSTTKSTFTASATPGATIAPKTAVKSARTGSSTPTGLALKAVTKTSRTGSSTPSGIVTPTKVVLLPARTGSIAPSPGTIRPFSVARNIAGAATPSGLLRKDVTKANRTGSITPAGSAPPAHIFNKPLSGSGTPTGLLRKMPVLPRAGSLTPTGALLPKTTTYLLTSTLGPTGYITRLRLPAAGMRTAPAKALSGAPVAGSRVTWEQFTPPGTTVTVKTSINNALTWDVVAASGDPVPGLEPGSTSVTAVLSRVEFTRPAGVFDLPWIDKLRVDVDEDDTTVEYVPLGVFDFEDAEISDDENGIEIQLTGLDLSSKIAAYAWESIFTQPKDKNLGDVLKAVISNRYPAAQFNFCSTEATAPATLTFGARDENNPWQDCLDIAEKCGCELYVDAYGVFTLRPEPDPEVGDPVWTFTDRAKAVMTKLKRRLTKSETKNYIVVTGESSGNTVPARGVAFDDDPTSASYIGGRLGKRVLRITSKLIGDDNAAIVYARAQLLRRKNLTETVSIDAVTNAAVQESDIVKVDRAASKLYGNFLIDRMRVPFNADANMTIEARRQRLAGSTPVGGGVGGLNGEEGGSGGTPDPATTAFKVAFTSCCNASDSSAYTDIKNESPDYFFHLGDVWYDDGGSNHVSHWNAQMGATNFAALIAALPNPPLIGWSDHDFGFANNAVGSGNSITATANSAYRTKFGSTGLPANGIYRTWTRGRIRFIYLDQLTFKSPLGTSSSTSRTMLGSTQKTWLKGLLADSAFPLIVIIGDGQWGGPAEDGQDEWRGYDAERKELKSAFQASPATIIALEGDTHSLAYAHDLYGIDRVWRASPINNNTKVKAAGADYTQTYPTNANEDDTNKHKHYGIIDFTDDNNSITVTFRGFGDGALQMTDTISISAPGGTGGGGTAPGTSVGDLLKIGPTGGFNHFNVGIGMSGGSHVDHTQSEIAADYNLPGYFEIVSGRARLSAHLDGGTTPGSSYPRVEFRELELDGTTKSAWDPDASGYHYIKALGRVTKLPPNKPHVVLLQCHDGSDDTVQLRVEGTNVKATINGSTVATLSSSFALNTDYYYMIRVEGTGSASVIKIYWGTTEAALSTPAYTSSSTGRSTGWYFKAGSYAQSNTSYDSVSDGPIIVELTKLECSRTGYPSPLGWT
jgi:hypothetical protein